MTHRRRIAASLFWIGALAGCNETKSSPATDDAAPAVSVEASPRSTSDVPAPPVRRDGTIYGESELMGTRVSINVWLADRSEAAKAGAAMQAALEEMARIEGIMSEWQPQTELSRLNARSGGDFVVISPELYEVLERGAEISRLTNGAFDPTFHGLGQLWSFRPGSKPPSREAIEAKLPLIDWRKLELDDTRRAARLREPGMKLGLGAIAKGYAVDRASQLLKEQGFPNHVVEGGGDTYASGTKDGKPWKVGVQRPDGPGVIGVIEGSDLAVVTSGNYQRYFEYEGKRYAHILDPRTGWPVSADKAPRSITMVAKNATDGDALCTALAVMGPDAALAFVKAHEGVDVVIVREDGRIDVSEGLEDIFLPVEEVRAQAER